MRAGWGGARHLCLPTFKKVKIEKIIDVPNNNTKKLIVF
jgi:hypothetical protein